MSRNFAVPMFMFLICAATIVGCTNSSDTTQTSVSEAVIPAGVTTESLPPGIAEIYGNQPQLGALLLLDNPDDAVWLTFEEDETCLHSVERDVQSERTEPVAELGRSDLVSGTGCNSPITIQEQGTISTGTSSRISLVTAVLPFSYWNAEWHLDENQPLGPFEVAGITPYSVHLTAKPSAIKASRRAGELGRFLNVSIVCECGDLSMKARIL